jgi:hypothetical protein
MPPGPFLFRCLQDALQGIDQGGAKRRRGSHGAGSSLGASRFDPCIVSNVAASKDGAVYDHLDNSMGWLAQGDAAQIVEGFRA